MKVAMRVLLILIAVTANPQIGKTQEQSSDSCPRILNLRKVFAEIEAAKKDPEQSVLAEFIGEERDPEDNSTPMDKLYATNAGFARAREFYTDIRITNCSELNYGPFHFKIDLENSNERKLTLIRIPIHQEPSHDKHKTVWELKSPGILLREEFHTIRRPYKVCDADNAVFSGVQRFELRWGKKVESAFANSSPMELNIGPTKEIFSVLSQFGDTNKGKIFDSYGCNLESTQPKKPIGGYCKVCKYPDQDDAEGESPKKDKGI